MITCELDTGLNVPVPHDLISIVDVFAEELKQIARRCCYTADDSEHGDLKTKKKKNCKQSSSEYLQNFLQTVYCCREYEWYHWFFIYIYLSLWK